MLASQIGYYSLVLGLLLSFIIIPISIKNFSNDYSVDTRIFSTTFLQFFFVLVSFLSLIKSFIDSDFSNETVFNNSHTSKPLFYKISGTWGNHEGSLLLWLLVLTFFIFVFLVKTKNQPKKYRILTLLFQQVIIIGFFLFVIITSNPFNYLYPIPKEGLGLNPILQDPALAIHPPILYFGYVGSSIIFSAALAGTSLNYISKQWAQHIKSWILVSWILLTVGIMLGSIWAYYELGWGGFWFWDPVENVSLMPWLCLTALLHSILVLERRASLSSWTIILSITTFTLSMCGTFLVRSGILNSVHTFANDPTRGIFILSFLFILILISLIIFFIFHKEAQENKNIFSFFGKDVSILINNWFVMYFLSVVLPFLIVFLIFMSLVPRLNWNKSMTRKVNIQSIILFVISILISILISKSIGTKNLINSTLILASFYLFLVTLKDFFSNKFSNYAQKISHFGFSLLILSILLNSMFSSEIIVNLRVGEQFTFKNSNISFNSIERKNFKNYHALVGSFKVEDNEKNLITLRPELRIYNQPAMVTSEADIKTTLFSDKFIVMNLVKGNEYFNVRYQVKPFMIWIWISTILLALGGTISLFKKNNEK